MTAWVALLRAVNVGGTGKLAMSELKAMCEELGFSSVKTYIASGNVVFASRKSEAAIKAAREAACGLCRQTDRRSRAQRRGNGAGPGRQSLCKAGAEPHHGIVPRSRAGGRRAQGRPRPEGREDQAWSARDLHPLRRRDGIVQTRHSRCKNRHCAQHEHGCDTRPNRCLNFRKRSGSDLGLELRYPGIPPLQEITQQRRVIGADGSAYRWTRSKRGAPACELWLLRQDAKVADPVEHVEIAKHRAEDGVDQRERFAIEPRRGRNARLKPRKTRLELGRFGLEGSFIGCRIKPSDVVEHG